MASWRSSAAARRPSTIAAACVPQSPAIFFSRARRTSDWTRLASCAALGRAGCGSGRACLSRMKSGGTTPRPASARDALDLEHDVARERLEPGDIGLAIGAGLDLVLAVEEVGHAPGRSRSAARSHRGRDSRRNCHRGWWRCLGHALAEPEHGVEPGLLARRQVARGRSAAAAADGRRAPDRRRICRPGRESPSRLFR